MLCADKRGAQVGRTVLSQSGKSGDRDQEKNETTEKNAHE
jgi:hypothetical protein